MKTREEEFHARPDRKAQQFRDSRIDVDQGKGKAKGTEFGTKKTSGATANEVDVLGCSRLRPARR